MKWSFPLVRVLGIEIDIHATFVLLLGWIGWLSYAAQGWAAVPWALLLIIILFACVTLHELGHCVVARRYGVSVHRITLLPIGGVAHLGSIPERPIQELLIAVGGPFVNVMIALALTPFSVHWTDFLQGNEFPQSAGGLIDRVIQANVGMLLFNLIPAFPMDGGRMLRAVLAMVTRYETATSLAASLGRFCAVLLAVWGFRFSPWLAVIGVFIYFSAVGEERMVHLRHRLHGRRVGDFAEQGGTGILRADEPLSRCVEQAFDEGQEDFVIVDQDRTVGLLPRNRWIEGLRRGPAWNPVAVAMQRKFACLGADADLFEAFRIMGGLRQEIIPVVKEGATIGYLRVSALRMLSETVGFGSGERTPAITRSARRSRGLDLG